jgi:hypothetical protein
VSHPCCFIPGERVRGTHWMEYWVDPRAGLDDMGKLKFLTLSRLEHLSHSQSLYCLVLRIIKKRNHSRRCGCTQLTLNNIFMANSTHYIPVSEKTVINSLITSVNLQPPTMNFHVVKNSVMCKNSNMRCGTALQVKLYELPVWQFGKKQPHVEAC